ncbi:MAG: Crp/Fnr family transcriptional regulator [Dehalococcoidia bacterium]
MERSASTGNGTYEFAPGHSVYREGDPLSALYVLLSGRIRLTSRAEGAPPIVTGVLRPGSLFGLDSLSQTSASESAIAETPASVQVVEVGTLDRLIARQHGFAARLMEALVRRRSAVEGLLTRALMTGVPGRLAGTLLDAADGLVVAGQTRQQLADAAWTTRETATRMLFQFAAAGLVKVDGRCVELIDVERLRRLAAGDRQQPAA